MDKIQPIQVLCLKYNLPFALKSKRTQKIQVQRSTTCFVIYSNGFNLQNVMIRGIEITV